MDRQRQVSEDHTNSAGVLFSVAFTHLPERATNTTRLDIFLPTAGCMSSTAESSSNLYALVCEHVCREMEPNQEAGMAWGFRGMVIAIPG